MPGRERTRAVVLFAAGAHAHAALEVARGARDLLPDVTIAVAGGAGVICPDGEVEGAAAVRALALTTPVRGAIAGAAGGTKARSANDPVVLGRTLGAALGDAPRSPVLLLVHPRAFGPPLLEGLSEQSGMTNVFGGGVDPEGGVALADPREEPRFGRALALRFDGGVRASIVRSAGVVPLGEALRVEATQGGYITKLGGRVPLEVLESVVRARIDRPFVLAAVEVRGADGERRPPVFVRAIAGVDPARGAVFVGEEIEPGDRVTFVALDADAARRDLDGALRDLGQTLGGGVPIAGFYVSCAARGHRLYGAPHVDSRLLRKRLGELPFAGMHGTFELAPVAGRPRFLTHSSVLGLLYAPS